MEKTVTETNNVEVTFINILNLDMAIEFVRGLNEFKDVENLLDINKVKNDLHLKTYNENNYLEIVKNVIGYYNIYLLKGVNIGNSDLSNIIENRYSFFENSIVYTEVDKFEDILPLLISDLGADDTYIDKLIVETTAYGHYVNNLYVYEGVYDNNQGITYYFTIHEKENGKFDIEIKLVENDIEIH